MGVSASQKVTATIVWKGKHKRHWIGAMSSGLAKHGIDTTMYWQNQIDRLLPQARRRLLAGIVIAWGWRVGQKLQRFGCSVLIMESPPIDAGENWISLGWNGLNGRATFPAVDDGGFRWNCHFQHLLKPWKPVKSGGDYILLVGQVRGDAALAGIDIEAWYQEAAARSSVHGLPIRFRPHPRDPTARVEGVETLEGDLESALEGAAVAVTYNSRVGVDAVLAGVPVIACDQGSMVWQVASHGLHEPLIRPDRTLWARRLAWCQWTQHEIADGTAWGHVIKAHQ